jgi:hypothetical protein
MPSKKHTIIFVPHARARFRQFRISSRLLWCVAGFVLLSVAVGATFSTLWVRSIQKNREVSALVAENKDLRTRARDLNGKLESLELLAEFEKRPADRSSPAFPPRMTRARAASAASPRFPSTRPPRSRPK